jgi:superfamily II DNA or RNA helicase
MSNTIICKEGYLIPKNTKNIEEIKKELTVEPFQVCSFGQKPDKFEIFQENDTYLSIPKFYGYEKFGKPTINKEKSGKKINIKFNSELREKQKEILKTVIPYLEKNEGGVMCLPCGYGKTILSLYLACYFQVKTLVIVHKSFLLNQWKERATEFTNATIGTLQRDKIDIDKDIVIGMLQSIAKDRYDSSVFKDFGLVIFDEAHHAPSKYFSRALPIISCKLSIGLSATPKRSDKMEKILYWYFGSIMYKLENQQNNSVLVNIINYNIEHEKFKEFYMMRGEVNRPKTINSIITIGRRNNFIVNTIEEVIIEDGRKILVLSDRVEHLTLLKNRINSKNITSCDYYIGGMNMNALKKSEEAQIILATYGMASEALDIPDLNTLFMVTPRREIEQAVGRITRKINAELRPIVYDFVDMLPTFINQSKHRSKFYKKSGFEQKYIDVENNEIITTREHVEIMDSMDCDFID